LILPPGCPRGAGGGSVIAYGTLGQLEPDIGCDTNVEIIRSRHLVDKFLIGFVFHLSCSPIVLVTRRSNIETHERQRDLQSSRNADLISPVLLSSIHGFVRHPEMELIETQFSFKIDKMFSRLEASSMTLSFSQLFSSSDEQSDNPLTGLLLGPGMGLVIDLG
jgi:hypothetical protein